MPRWIALTLLLATLLAHADPDESRAIADRLVQLGFPCVEAPAPKGFHCQLRIANYSMPVDIFVTHEFSTTRTFTLAYHLHGWWLDPNSTPFDGPEGDFARFLVDSRKNILLVMPESRGRNETFARELNTAAKVQSFFTRVEEILRAAGVPVAAATPTLLSGHSGAYVAMGLMGDFAKQDQVSRLRALKGVALFDSAYGYRTGLVALADVICRTGGGRYGLYFNPADGSEGKKTTNEKIHREIRQAPHGCRGLAIGFVPDRGTGHVQFPRRHMAEFFSQAVTW